MNMALFFVVQSFSPAKRGAMKADVPVQATSMMHARRMAERLAQQKPMVFATVIDADPEAGDYGDPKLIFAHGEDLPEEIMGMEKV
ncbi:hypothetical protein KYK29_10245 [Shinella daejeonensis]|nr:hypothetical protein [Shinella daejeonensis]